MNKLLVYYDSDAVYRLLEAVQDFNTLPVDDSMRNLKLLFNQNFGENQTSMLVARRGEINGNDRKDYLLTVTPEWCLNLEMLEDGDQENLKKLFEQYYSNNVFAQKPKDMWKADLSVNVLVKDVETMDSNVITLDEFQREISEIIQKDFLHTSNVLNF